MFLLFFIQMAAQARLTRDQIEDLIRRKLGKWEKCNHKAVLTAKSAMMKQPDAQGKVLCNFEEYILNGGEKTFAVRCSSQSCRARLKQEVTYISLIASYFKFFVCKSSNCNYNGMFFTRHLKRALGANLTQPNSNQPSISAYTWQPSLSDAAIREVRRNQCFLVASGCVPISRFEGAGMKNLTRSIIQAVTPKNADIEPMVEDLCTSSRSLTRYAKQENQKVVDLIRKNATKIGIKGAGTVMVDHQTMSRGLDAEKVIHKK